MKLQVSRWGNSLAVRLPVERTRTAGLKVGGLYKFKILSEARRERNFSAQHMFDM